MRSLDDLLTSTRNWRERLAGVVPPAPLDQVLDLEPARGALASIERRLVEGHGAPLRIAIFGPTGAGKSKVFNSLLREPLSPSSYRRPCTRWPVIFLHHRHAALAEGLRGEVRLHRRSDWESRMLIDAPDFDSVEAENRALAEHIYLEADAFIFVADVHKYADASTWSYLRRIRAEGKACAFVLNKVAAGGRADDVGGPLADFRRRLEDAFRPDGLPGPVLAIADRPQEDDALLPVNDPGIERLRGELERFQDSGADGGPSLLTRSFEVDVARFLAEWDRVSVPLRDYRAGIERVKAAVEAACERRAEDLRRDLQAEVDPGLKDEVYREVLRRIEKIDVLRYPRRLLSLPIRGARKLVGRVWRKARPGDARSPGEQAAAACEAMNLPALEGRLQDLAEDLLAAFRSESACPALADDPAWASLRPDHASLREKFLAASGGFRTWAETEARSAASALTAEHKVKFILSQLIYNTVVIGVQVKTAGTLTLSEMFTDGILSPLVAKAVGVAVSSERVQEFETAARQEYSRRLVEVLAEERDRTSRRLAEKSRGLAEIPLLLSEVEALRASRERLVEMFARGSA